MTPVPPDADAAPGGGTARAGTHRAFSTAGLNLLAGVLPIPLAIVTVPAVIGGFGVERYGILATGGVVLAYFALLDVGLGRAGTRFLAWSLGVNDADAVAETFWTVTVLALAIGVAASALLLLIAAPLARSVLRVSPGLVPDSVAAFRALAAAVPFVILLPTFLGALEAHRRFDLVAALQVPTTALGLLAPLLVLPWTTRLMPVILAVALVQAVACGVGFAMCLATVPGARWRIRIRRHAARDLLGYGRWVAVSNLVGPLMVSLDRLAIGAVLSVRTVAFYAAPYDLVTRLSLLPASLMRALFPLFSSDRSPKVAEARRLAVDGARAIALVMGPAAVCAIAIAPDVLRLWLGPEFARLSASSFQLLAVGVTVNALAMVPFWLLQGLGRPDVCAKFHLIELAVYVPMLFVFLGWWGITGAAAAWTVRVVLDGALLLWAVHRLVGAAAHAAQLRRLRAYATLVGTMLVLAWAVAAQGPSVAVRLASAVALTAAAIGLGWNVLLSGGERAGVLAVAATRWSRGAP